MIHNRGSAASKDAVKKDKKAVKKTDEDILLQGSLYGSESIVKK